MRARRSRLRLRNRCADQALIDDVVRETFLALWRGSARYREREGARARAVRVVGR
ncbi:sigma factor [Actinomadura sp. 9N215]|uniref:sigma factor n=1 Tax=Actinomadura sp. 9N215 TaxID=3375150 RepID=UPI0037AFDE18